MAATSFSLDRRHPTSYVFYFFWSCLGEASNLPIERVLLLLSWTCCIWASRNSGKSNLRRMLLPAGGCWFEITSLPCASL